MNSSGKSEALLYRFAVAATKNKRVWSAWRIASIADTFLRSDSSRLSIGWPSMYKETVLFAFLLCLPILLIKETNERKFFWGAFDRRTDGRQMAEDVNEKSNGPKNGFLRRKCQSQCFRAAGIKMQPFGCKSAFFIDKNTRKKVFFDRP